MASNTYINKIIYDGNTLIDLTSDTITSDKLLLGYTAHDASGASIIGNFNSTQCITSVIPTENEQIITPDNDYYGFSQITVEPIPSNYGLITWDGTTLTVS